MRIRPQGAGRAAALLICLLGAGAGFATAATIATPTTLASPSRLGVGAGESLRSCTTTPTNTSPTGTTTASTPTGTDTSRTPTETDTSITGTTTTGTTGTPTTGTSTTVTTPTCTTTTPTTTTPANTVPTSDAPPPAAPATKALLALQKTLAADLNAQGGQNSGLVIDETTDRTLWSYNASVGRLPASVEKLYTTSTALLELGPQATFKTDVYGTGRLLAGGIWDGTLYLRGGGDPTFGSASFDHAMYGTGATVQALAQALRRAGVKQVEGRVLGDESYFDSRRGGPDTHYRANIETEGSLSALAYDAGFTNLQEDALQANPPLVATQAFTAALKAARVRVAKNLRIGLGRTPARAQLLASVSSPPLSRLLALTNAPSDNFFAETLLKDLGAQLGKGGTTADGAAVVRHFILQRFGLRPRLNDGSGLSRYDLTNTEQVVYLLRAMQPDPTFWTSLAVAGVSGTMQQEMLHTRAVDNCRGKTGTLHDVANLVGYCRAANGDQLVFAFLMNGLSDSDAGHELEDLAGEALANYKG